jgi:hypothetical protein
MGLFEIEEKTMTIEEIDKEIQGKIISIQEVRFKRELRGLVSEFNAELRALKEKKRKSEEGSLR